MSGAAGSTIALTFPSGTGLSNLGNAGIVTDNTTSGHRRSAEMQQHLRNHRDLHHLQRRHGQLRRHGHGRAGRRPQSRHPVHPRGSPVHGVGVDRLRPCGAVTSNTYTVTSAQSVSNVTVTNTPPTTATSAPTVYKTTFTTSSTGGMSGAAGSSISIAFPSGTDVGKLTNAGIVTDNTTSGHPEVGGDCSFLGKLGDLHHLQRRQRRRRQQRHRRARRRDQPGPPSGPNNPYSASVMTSSDNLAATPSNTYTVLAAQSVSNVTVTNTPPTTATSAPTVYIDHALRPPRQVACRARLAARSRSRSPPGPASAS